MSRPRDSQADDLDSGPAPRVREAALVWEMRCGGCPVGWLARAAEQGESRLRRAAERHTRAGHIATIVPIGVVHAKLTEPAEPAQSSQPERSSSPVHAEPALPARSSQDEAEFTPVHAEPAEPARSSRPRPRSSPVRRVRAEPAERPEGWQPPAPVRYFERRPPRGAPPP